jgi:DNA polymerase V
VCTLAELEEAAAAYTHEAVRRLRAQNSRARFVSVFLMTSPWDDAGPQHCDQRSAALASPTSYLPDILDTASALLRDLYREGHRYRKVMVNLLGLEDDVVSQPDLFAETAAEEGKQALMRCFDSINRRYGQNAIRTALNIPGSRSWSMRRRFLSPAYTTDLAGIPDVY